MIKAVVFDLDGTLISLPIDYEGLFRRFSRILNTDDVRPLAKTVAGLDEKTRKKIFEIWDEEELALKDKITIKDEGVALYKKYATMPKALVTMQGKALVQTVLKPLGLVFKLAITRENSLDRAEQLKMVIQKVKVNPENLLFVGNTDGDLHAAEEVKCQFLRVGK